MEWHRFGADPDPNFHADADQQCFGSEIRLFNPWIQDSGSRMGKTSASGFGIRTRDELPRSYFLELRNHFFGLKYLNSSMRIWEGKKSDPGRKKIGSGMEKSRIGDNHPGTATMPNRIWTGIKTISILMGILPQVLHMSENKNQIHTAY